MRGRRGVLTTTMMMSGQKSSCVTCNALAAAAATAAETRRTTSVPRKRRTWGAAWLLMGCIAWAAVARAARAALIAPSRVSATVTGSRYLSAWRKVNSPILRTVKEARGRVVYSAVRGAGGEGLGHAMATVNADVSAALRLGVAYTHRVATHGALTRADGAAVERFFGWGDGEIPRSELLGACGQAAATSSHCLPCEARGDAVWSRGVVSRVVNIPLSLSYGYFQKLPQHRAPEVAAFLAAHAHANTVFQMPLSLCSKSPAQSRFTNQVRRHFHRKYWQARKRHAAAPRLDDAELSIAIHARRGDFFQARRPMVSIRVFGALLRAFARAVQRRGGAFARMRIAVLVFSEGVPVTRNDTLTRWRGHDVTRTRPQFIDISGVARDETWVRNELLGGASSRILFPAGLRVELRIATDTLQAAHEMIAADAFFGSLSGLSMHVVGSLGRGAVIALPATDIEQWPGHLPFDADAATFRNLSALQEAWNRYADIYEKHAQNALNPSVR